MKQTKAGTTTAETTSTWNGVERRRVEKVVATLATLRGRGESLSEVAHDTRNMVTALALYCDLLEEPGVLSAPFRHYAQELRLVTAASRRLVEKLVALDTNFAANLATNLDTNFKTNLATNPSANLDRRNTVPDVIRTSRLQANDGRSAAATGGALPTDSAAAASSAPAAGAMTAGIVPQSCASAGNSLWEDSASSALANPALSKMAIIDERNQRCDLLPCLPVANLAAELMANRNLLAALAGPSVALTVETEGGAQAVRLTAEDLTRLLVNLVKNSAEAMLAKKATEAMPQASTQGHRIRIGLRETEISKGAAPCLELTVEDNGQGIPEEALDRIFTTGYTSRTKEAAAGGWPQSHRGLGLAIVRSIVEGAGGRITAQNRAQDGACFTLELPVRKTGNRD